MAAPDVVVVGAGVAGAAAAYFLAKAGFAVTLFDQGRAGGGASGHNPGFLWLQSKAAGLPLDFSLAGRAFQAALGEEIGDFGFREAGALSFFRESAMAPLVADFVARRTQDGLPMQLLDRATLERQCPQLAADVIGAAWGPLEAHQDTRRLVERLVAAAVARGVTLRLGERVLALTQDAGRCSGVQTAGGRIAAGLVVLASGAGSRALLGSLGLTPPLAPVRYQAAETAPAPFSLGPLLAGPSLLQHIARLDGRGPDQAAPAEPLLALAPGCSFTHQAAQYADGRIQYGCLCEPGEVEPRATVAGQALGAALWARDLPALARLPLERTWGAVVAQTPDYLPIVDAAPGPEGLALTIGHAFGNLVGALSGHLLAVALTGGTPAFPLEGFRLARFAPTPPPAG